MAPVSPLHSLSYKLRSFPALLKHGKSEYFAMNQFQNPLLFHRPRSPRPALAGMFRGGQANPQAPEWSGRLRGRCDTNSGKRSRPSGPLVSCTPTSAEGGPRPCGRTRAHPSSAPGRDGPSARVEAGPEFIILSRALCAAGGSELSHRAHLY